MMKKYALLLSAALSCALYAQTLKVESGWNLLSISEPSTTADCILQQMPTGSMLYKYNNVEKKWEAKANTETINSMFAQKGYGTANTISATEGFWLYNPLAPRVINQTCTTTTTATTAALTQEQKYALAYMWNEEKMAKDIYLALNELYPNQTLYNIATRSETQHEAAVEQLVQNYDLNISDLENFAGGYSAQELSTIAPGKFTVPEVQELYDALYTKGSQSLQDALEVGCMVEVTDVNDLNQDIALVSDKPDIVSVFEFLRSGSYNHYWAFDRALKAIGVTEGCCSLGEEYCKTPEEFPSNNQGNGKGHGRR